MVPPFAQGVGQWRPDLLPEFPVFQSQPFHPLFVPLASALLDQEPLVSLAACVARLGREVLLVDCAPAHAPDASVDEDSILFDRPRRGLAVQRCVPIVMRVVNGSGDRLPVRGRGQHGGRRIVRVGRVQMWPRRPVAWRERIRHHRRRHCDLWSYDAGCGSGCGRDRATGLVGSWFGIRASSEFLGHSPPRARDDWGRGRGGGGSNHLGRNNKGEREASEVCSAQAERNGNGQEMNGEVRSTSVGNKRRNTKPALPVPRVQAWPLRRKNRRLARSL